MTGAVVRNWAMMYSYSSGYPFEILRKSFRFGTLKRAMSTSCLYVVMAASRSPDGAGTGESSWLADSRLTRKTFPYSVGSPFAISAGRYCFRSQVRNRVSNSSIEMSKTRRIGRSIDPPREFRYS